MKHEKQLLLDEITNQISSAPSFIIAKYAKLSANKTNTFRREMSKIGGNFEVVKKRVFLKALEKVGVKLNLDSLPGHIGIIFSSADPIETTKTIIKFSNDNDKSLMLLGARVEGQFIGSQDVDRLSKLPSKDAMRAQLLGLFEAPMAQTLATIEALLSTVVYCLDNKAHEQGG